MPEFSNATGLEFIDVIREGFLSQFVGSYEVAFLLVVSFVMVALMIIGARRETVLMIPIPLIFIFTLFSDFLRGILVIYLIGLGVYISTVLWKLFSKK